MKTITSSVGILALGAASLHAVYAPGLTTIDASKRWTLSAGVRAFYDDNYNTAPDATKEGSAGLEVNPRIGFNLPMDQTLVTGGYEFSGRYYEDRPDSDWDFSHQFNLNIDHAFSERYKVMVKESLVLTEDPEILQAGGPLRSQGDNVRNSVDILFRGEFSKTMGYELGYANNFYDFKKSGVGSYSALLDRLEHLISANALWFVQPQTTARLGYQFRLVDYTSSDAIAPGFAAELRNSRTHTVFLGVDHDFTSQLRLAARGGFSTTDTYNQNVSSATDPYADVSLTYAYSSAGSAQLGIKHQRNQTDVIGVAGPNNLVNAQQSTTVYGSVNHRITEFLSGSLLGLLQESTFDGGSLDGQNESFYSLGATLRYDFTRNWAAELGYSLDKLNSDAATRDFTRNRVFIGVRATY
jgi:hypothetical protein